MDRYKLLLNAKELCDMTHLNKNDLTLYRRTGLLKAIKKGKKYLYPMKEVEKFIEISVDMDLTNQYTILATKK